MGLKQKKAVAKKESGDLKVDKTSKAGYDRSNVAEVIKRLKQMAKEDTNRFDKMGLDETLERLEASERVAASALRHLLLALERVHAYDPLPRLEALGLKDVALHQEPPHHHPRLAV